MTRPAFRVSAAIAAAAATAFALTACSGSGSDSSSSDTHFVTGTGTSATVPVKDRGAAISLSGKDLDGKPLSIADYRGKIVVLNVWGSWCGPCRAEAGDLESVFKATQAQGVQFVGINTRDLQVPAAKSFVSAHGLTYPNLYDPDGELLLKFPKGSLNPQAIPSTLILDREGRVAVRALQPLTSDQLTKLLQPVLAEKS